MGIKTLFRKSNSRNLKAQAYDSHVAADPPIQGTYPVAGNGPNVLDDLQRSHVRRTSVSSAAPSPFVPRSRDERPQTAPYSGFPWGGRRNSLPTSDNASERTRSGFSMSSTFLSNRRSSIANPKAKRASWFPKNETPLPAPAQIQTASPRAEIETHQPTQRAQSDAVKHLPGKQPTHTMHASPRSASYYPPPTKSTSSHTRSDSQLSRISHVDVLDAQSSLHRAKELHRSKGTVSGLRDFGEHVADRNMVRAGAGNSTIDFDSPEFSYVKKLYSPRRTTAVVRDSEAYQTRVDSALGHILGDSILGDDIQPPGESTSHRSGSGPRPKPVKTYPPRTDSASSHVALRNAKVEMQKLPPKRATSSDSNQRRSRPTSLSSTTSLDDDCKIRYHKPLSPGKRSKVIITDTHDVLNAPVPDRGRSRIALPAVPRIPSNIKLNASLTTPHPQTRTISTSRDSTITSSRPRKHSASSITVPTQNKMGLPQESHTQHAVSSTKAPNIRSKEVQHSLQGVVGQKDSVDTSVVNKILSAVTHEHITPIINHVREESTKREVHNYDVNHRVLPVIQTVVLPAKHYIRELDGSITEIPEAMLSQFNIVKSVHSREVINEPGEDDSSSSSGASWRLPVPTLLPNLAHSIRTYSASHSLNRSTIEPFPSSKLETPTGIAAFPILSSSGPSYTSQKESPNDTAVEETNNDCHSSDDEGSIEIGAEKTEGDLLFSNSGYGDGGMLPGLAEPDPAYIGPVPTQARMKYIPETPRIVDSSVGEVTLGLRRLRDKLEGKPIDGNSIMEKERDETSVEDGVKRMTLK